MKGRWSYRNSKDEPDEGFTLVEILVAIGLFTLVGTILLGVGLSTAQVGKDTERIVRLDEEARLALERLSREVRQASRVSVQAADRRASGSWRAFRVTVNFDRNLNLEATPEVLEYRWYSRTDSPRYRQLTLSPVPNAEDEEASLLAAKVKSFSVDLLSSNWEYDGSINGVDPDGVTTWQEIDAAKDNDGVPDPDELALVDLLHVTITVVDGTFERTHSTQIYLRNAETP